MEWKPSKKIEVSQPKDRSLDAYKAWVRELAQRLTKTELKFTEQEWIESWKEYWGKTSAR
jgi:hypothetical protein